MAIDVRRIESDRLSTYRTRHEFLHHAEFRTLDEYREARSWARAHGLPVYILGNGSNTLFTSRTVRTLVLRNSLEPWMKDLGGGRVEASSSLHVMKLMKFCEKNQLDSFYYMASVPATAGGALAMNAGAGAGPTVYDFVESLTYLEGDELITLQESEVARSHRHTMFAGVQDRLIVSAVFRFPEGTVSGNEIRERVAWYKSHQDGSAPNCGSVFKESYRPILAAFRRLPPFGTRIPGFHAQFSRTVNNWIISTGPDSWPIVALVRAVQLAHRIAGKKAVTELIEVD